MAPNMTPTFSRRTKTSVSSIRGSSTDIEDDDNDSTRLPSSRLRGETMDVLAYVVNRRNGVKVCANPCGETMYKHIQEMYSNHSSFFSGLCRKLNMHASIPETFTSVADGIFDSGLNYGRLVSFFAWSLYVVELCNERNLDSDANAIYSRTADCLEAHRNEFLNLGGWDGFVEFFKDTKTSVWKGLLFTTVSLGALAALLFVKS